MHLLPANPGVRSGYLTLQVITTTGGGKQLAECECDCGKTKTVAAESFSQRAATHCGCLGDRPSKRRLRHRYYDYLAYQDMLACHFNPNHPDYAKVGGKGCEPEEGWVGPEGFRNFLKYLRAEDKAAKKREKQRAKNQPRTWCSCSCPYWGVEGSPIARFVCECGELMLVCIQCLQDERITGCGDCQPPNPDGCGCH